MVDNVYSDLQIREIFHLEFLRFFGRKFKPDLYALKGGVNLRLFFNSIRYSEDMDLDVRGTGVYLLKDCIMNILQSPMFQGSLKSFGIKQIIPPAIECAKQTETTQRFKIHLVTSADVDLFTKIELSRRGMMGEAIVQAPSEQILRVYKIAPVLIPHYDINSAIMHKIKALTGRALIQARDIFDLYILSGQFNPNDAKKMMPVEGSIFSKAYDSIFEIKFEVFRDTVVAYLAPGDQAAYNNPSAWEEIRLKTADFIERLGKKYA